MKRYVYILVATMLAAVSVPASAASSGSGATPQRIEITIRPATETFELRLASGDSVVRDRGSVTWTTVGERFLTRDGQRVRVWTGFGRFSGMRGDLGLRLRWEWLNAGREHEAGVGTWSVVEGTRSYAALRGGGRGAAVWLPGRPVASRVDGFVRKG